MTEGAAAGVVDGAAVVTWVDGVAAFWAKMPTDGAAAVVVAGEATAAGVMAVPKRFDAGLAAAVPGEGVVEAGFNPKGLGFDEGAPPKPAKVGALFTD